MQIDINIVIPLDIQIYNTYILALAFFKFYSLMINKYYIFNNENKFKICYLFNFIILYAFKGYIFKYMQVHCCYTFLIRCAKNCVACEIYLICKLTNIDNFMNTSKRHETLGLELLYSLTFIAKDIVSILSYYYPSSLSPNSHLVILQGPNDDA